MEVFRVVHVYWQYAPARRNARVMQRQMYREVYDTTDPLPLVESLSLQSNTVKVEVIPPEHVNGPRDRGGWLPVIR